MDVAKERIISKSLELFTQIGVKVITMDMICYELGMSKKTLYEHFTSKEDLIKQSFNEQMNEFIEKFKNKITHISNPIAQLSYIFENSLYFIKKDKVSFQLQKFYPNIYTELLKTQDIFIKDIIKNNIASGIKDGLYRSKIQIDLVIDYIVMILYNINEDEFLKANCQKYFFELVTRSIATKKGLKEI